MSILPIEGKWPFCQCLHESELNLERTQHCVLPCEDQQIILAERQRLLEKAQPLIEDLEKASNESPEVIFHIGSNHFTIKEMIDEIRNLTPAGRIQIRVWLNLQAKDKQ